MSSRGSHGEPVEVWLWEPGHGRPDFGFEGPLEYLPADSPLPQLGDLVYLPRNVTGDTKEQSFAWGGKLTPFRVVERVHAYFRESDEKLDPRNVKPAHYLRSMIAVRRVTQAAYVAGPETVSG